MTKKQFFGNIYRNSKGELAVRLDRIMGVVLSILALAYFGIQAYNDQEQNNNPFELLSDSGYLSDNVATLEDKVLSSNDSTSEIIEFTNPYNYSVELNQSDITITCHGTGATKESDELLVSSNYTIKAKFSKEKSGILDNSLLVSKGEKAYIHVISEYNGSLPSSQVSCEYSVSVMAN